jgi:hypothetical protein
VKKGTPPSPRNCLTTDPSSPQYPPLEITELGFPMQ